MQPRDWQRRRLNYVLHDLEYPEALLILIKANLITDPKDKSWTGYELCSNALTRAFTLDKMDELQKLLEETAVWQRHYGDKATTL